MRSIPVQLAFWTAVLLGMMAAMSVPSAVVLGIVEAALFWMAAWSIWRGNGWAALSAAVLVGLPACNVAASVKMPSVALTLLVLVDVALLAGGVTLLRARRARSRVESAAWIATALCVAAFFATLQPMNLPSPSMEPTLAAGDMLLIETVSQRFGRVPRRGDLVAFHPPFDAKQTFVKRVVAVPGDRVRMVNKRLHRNGAPVDEPYAVHRAGFTVPYQDNFPDAPPANLYPGGEEMLRSSVREGAVVVPPGKLFVLGDNRDSSLDSRYWGFVDQAAVVGRPLLVYGAVNAPLQIRMLNGMGTR